jgi:hypothetical protein
VFPRKPTESSPTCQHPPLGQHPALGRVAASRPPARLSVACRPLLCPHRS